MENMTGDLPIDYEICSCCGWDHDYDLPLLSPKEYRKARILHEELEEEMNRKTHG